MVTAGHSRREDGSKIVGELAWSRETTPEYSREYG
jgi:hypothetical protein